MVVCYGLWQKQFKGPHYEAYFWQAADAYNEYVFNKAMTQMKKLNMEAYQYLMDVDLQLWARFKFNPDVCAPDNTNNFTESFNATLGLDRVKPMLTLAEGNCKPCLLQPDMLLLLLLPQIPLTHI